MKALFINTQAKVSPAELKALLKKVRIKGKIGLVSIIQYIHLLPEIQNFIQGSVILGQVTGCNLSNLSKAKVDSYLYIGPGKFHPIYIARKTKKPTYILNPETEEFSQISNKEIEQYEKQRLGKIKKFIAADRIGIIVSTKPGQENLKLALNLKASLKQESFIFAANTLQLEELENFPQIQFWVNTSCPRIEGNNLINFEDIPKAYIPVKPKAK